MRTHRLPTDETPRLLSLSDLHTECPAWALEGIDELRHELGRERSDFPCTFGIQNYKENSLRFLFVEDERPHHMEHMALGLRAYTRDARTFGASSSSLVCVFRPIEGLSVQGYERWFWRVLQQLHDRDDQAWPAGYSTDPAHDTWAFCFAGEGHFVVCNTPAHRDRRSRRNANPMITFTPRWSFAGIEGDSRPGIAVRELIRQRVARYDRVPPFAHFSAYGHGLDWVQYFLPDGTEPGPLATCPFSVRREEKAHG